MAAKELRWQHLSLFVGLERKISQATPCPKIGNLLPLWSAPNQAQAKGLLTEVSSSSGSQREDWYHWLRNVNLHKRLNPPQRQGAETFFSSLSNIKTASNLYFTFIQECVLLLFQMWGREGQSSHKNQFVDSGCQSF